MNIIPRTLLRMLGISAERPSITEAFSASWLAFCDTYNVDATRPSSDEIDYYIDSWHGSSDEMAAIAYPQYLIINSDIA